MSASYRFLGVPYLQHTQCSDRQCEECTRMEWECVRAVPCHTRGRPRWARARSGRSRCQTRRRAPGQRDSNAVAEVRHNYAVTQPVQLEWRWRAERFIVDVSWMICSSPLRHAVATGPEPSASRVYPRDSEQNVLSSPRVLRRAVLRYSEKRHPQPHGRTHTRRRACSLVRSARAGVGGGVRTCARS
jgi:hypothetical protein